MKLLFSWIFYRIGDAISRTVEPVFGHWFGWPYQDLQLVHAEVCRPAGRRFARSMVGTTLINTCRNVATTSTALNYRAGQDHVTAYCQRHSEGCQPAKGV